eukprot:g11010.t1
MSRHGFLGTGSNSSSSGSNSSGGRKRRAGTAVLVTVFEAETGRRHDVELSEGGHEGGGATEALRRKLYSLTGVPAENQILLHGGPPYKPLRSQLPPASVTVAVTSNVAAVADATSSSAPKTTTKATKIFLFDWRTLAPEQQQQRHMRSSSNPQSISGSAMTGHLAAAAASSYSPLVGGGSSRAGVEGSLFSTSPVVPGGGGGGDDAPPAITASEEEFFVADTVEFAGPEEVDLPTEPSASPSPLPTVEGSVLLKTIANYERGSMLALNRGQAYLEASRRRLRGGEACAERMQTMVDALDAAVSNSLDHWEPLQRAYMGLRERLGEQALRHEGMLQTFEQDVDTLGTIPLHPALQAASGGAQQELQQEGEEISGGGRGGGKTLLDCIPVEREQRLLESCRTSQRRFRLEGDNVAQKYSAIEKGIQEQRGDPVTTNDAVQELLERARGLCREQEAKKDELEANYLESFNLARENWTEADNLQDAISRLTQLTIAQEKIVPIMRSNDLQARDIVVEITKTKAVLSRRVRRRLRQVSRLQTDIGKIQKHQELVGMAWGQKEEQFEHLGKVARMPAAYKAFLQEVLRQRRYHETFEAKVTEFCSSMAALRADEIVAREAFLQTHLPNLPPVFVEMAPGLRNMPPMFSPGSIPQLRPGDLPEVYPDAEMEKAEEEGGEEEEAAKSTSQVAVDCSGGGRGDGERDGDVNRAGTGGAATKEGAAVATQTGAELASEGAAVATQTETETAAVEAEVDAVGTQTVAAEAAAVATQTVEAVPLSSDDGNGSGGGVDDGFSRGVSGGGGGGGNGEGGDSSSREGGGSTDKHATDSAASASGEVAKAVPAVEGRNDQEDGTGRDDAETRPGEEGLGASPAAAAPAAAAAGLQAENARLVEELAEARARLDQLESRAAEAEALARCGEPGEDVAPVGPSGAGGTGGVGGESRSYSDVVGRGRVSRASDAPAPAGADDRDRDRERERGSAGGRSRGSGGGRRGSSSKEAMQSQLAAYRAGLSMLVKLTDQQRSSSAAVSTVDATAVAPPSPGNPESENTETPERVAATAAAAAAATAVAGDGEAGSSSPPASDDQGGRGNQSSSPSTVTLGKAVVGEGERGDNDAPCAGGAPPSGTATPGGAATPDEPKIEPSAPKIRAATPDEPKIEPSAPEIQEVVATAGDGQADETSPIAPEAATTAPEVAAAAAAGKVEAAAAAAAAPPPTPSAAATEGAAAAPVPGEQRGQRQAEAAVEAAGEDTSAPTSPASPDQKQVPLPSPGGSPAAVAGPGAGAEPGTAAGPGKAAGSGTVALRPVDRIGRAADYVATHLRHNHVRVQELLAFEALASVPRISMCSFRVQDIALFLPTMVGSPEGSEGGPVFLAFHVNCPNRYLSEESINNAREALGSSPAYILGRIILVEQYVASEEPNPYNVPPNTVYYVLTAENAG